MRRAKLSTHVAVCLCLAWMIVREVSYFARRTSLNKHYKIPYYSGCAFF